MRKITKRTVVEEVTHEEEQAFCDLCGLEAIEVDYDGPSWTNECYEIDTTEIKISIKQKEGMDYGEGPYGYKTTIDLCPKCFK